MTMNRKVNGVLISTYPQDATNLTLKSLETQECQTLQKAISNYVQYSKSTSGGKYIPIDPAIYVVNDKNIYEYNVHYYGLEDVATYLFGKGVKCFANNLQVDEIFYIKDCELFVATGSSFDEEHTAITSEYKLCGEVPAVDTTEM